MKVYAFAIITDSWGDIPYFEAGRGYIDQNFTPVFDTQEAIYMDFFNELSEAIAARMHLKLLMPVVIIIMAETFNSGKNLDTH